MELVLVYKLVVACAELSDGLVVLVKDGNVAMAMTVACIVVALEAEEDILTLPAGRLEVGCPADVLEDRYYADRVESR